jgi:hypothetical protein
LPPDIDCHLAPHSIPGGKISMLCQDKYTQQYIDECRARVVVDLSAYNVLVRTAKKAAVGDQPKLDSAVKAFEPRFFANMLLALECSFVHRSRVLELTDGNPLNETRLICDSIMNSGGILTADKTISYDPAESILKLKVGDEIKLSAADFALLSAAFLLEIEHKYL